MLLTVIIVRKVKGEAIRTVYVPVLHQRTYCSRAGFIATPTITARTAGAADSLSAPVDRDPRCERREVAARLTWNGEPFVRSSPRPPIVTRTIAARASTGASHVHIDIVRCLQPQPDSHSGCPAQYRRNSQRVLLRRQPDGRRVVKPVLPPGTGSSRPIPARYGPPFASITARRHPGEPGRQRHAQGGARVTQLPGYPASRRPRPRCRSPRRCRSSSPRARLIRNALYSVRGGANDLFTQLDDAACAITPAQGTGQCRHSAAQLARQVAALQAAGARYVMAWNVPTSARRRTAGTPGWAP